MNKPVPTKVKLTPEQRAAFKSIRQQAEADRPGPDELIERGDVEEFVSQGAFMELLIWVDALRRERERRGLSLTDMAKRSGLTRAMVSKLESGRNPNPTLDTLARYALALDMQVKLSADPLPAAEGE
jgi:DNA-binding XRE family transcriptional regulator